MKHAALLSVPVPILAAVVPQLQKLPGELPGWVATGLLGVWVTLWFLDRVGKLPGRADGERRSHAFTTEDRDKLERLYHLFLFRGDEDGIERFPKFMQEVRVTDREIVELLRQTNDRLERLIVIHEREL